MSDQVPSTPATPAADTSAPAAPAAPTPAPAQTSDPNTSVPSLSFEQLDSILSYDPFGGKDHLDLSSEVPSAPAKPDDKAAVSAAPGTTPPAQPQTPSPIPAAPAAPAAPSPEVVALQQQLAELRTQLEARNQPSANQPPAADPSTSAEAPLPEYRYNVPDQLLQALDSDDPAQRRMGLHAVMQGVSQQVHQQMRMEVSSVMQNMMQSLMSQHVPTLFQQLQEQQKVQQDFYGTYGHLNKPELKPIVMQVAQNLVKQGKFPGQWTNEFRDLVAATVHQTLGIPLPSVAAPAIAPTAPAASVPAAPTNVPPMLTGSVPATRSGNASLPTPEDIMKTLF